MKTLHRSHRAITSALLLATALLAGRAAAQAQTYWTGAAGSPLNWSAGGNWYYGSVPGTADNVLFDYYFGGGFTNAQGLVNNYVDTSLTISTLGYDVTNAYFTTQINPGVTLSVVPQLGAVNALAVGEWLGVTGGGTPIAGGANDTLYYTVVGPNGTLKVNGPTSSIRVEEPDGTSGSHWATLDLSGLGTFNATVSNITVGADFPMTRPNGTLVLARNNTLKTGAWGANTPGIILGCGGSTTTDGGQGNLTLGQVNVFNVDWLAVGGHRGSPQGTSTLTFGSGISGGSFQLRGSSGSRAPLVTIGDNQANDGGNSTYLGGTSRGASGNADFSGATVDIQVDTLILGRNLTTNETTAFNTGATGTGTGTMTFDNGMVDVNNLYIGYKAGTNYGGASGTLTVNGGTLTVNNSLILSQQFPVNGGTHGTGTGTLNIASNATVTVKADVVKGGTGAGTANLSVNSGGSLTLQPPGGGAGNVTVNSLTLNGGALQNVSNVTVSGTMALTSTTLTNAGGVISAGTLTLNGGNLTNGSALTAGTITTPGRGVIANIPNVTNSTSLVLGTTDSAGSLLVAGNFTLNANATLSFALNNDTTTDGGVNSYLKVDGDLTLGGNNVLSLATLAPLSAGPYRLVDYTGVLSGTPVLTNSTRYALALDYSTPGQINLQNNGGSAMNLTWSGSTASGGTNWNVLATTNWNGQTQPFFQCDSVTFDNTGVTTGINTIGLLYPGLITVNDSRNYSFLGAGKISGNTGITKNGSGMLLVNNTGGNDFNGPIQVNAGILRVSRADAFGSTNGSTTIASGAMLDLNGVACNSPGETVVISGTGLTNAGAIINTGANQNNGLRYVSLAGDATIGNWPGRWDVRGPGAQNSLSGGLYLNGFTLTKTGLGRNSIVDCIMTNAGSLVINSGNLAFTRSWVDGPGTITVNNGAMLVLENFGAISYITKPIIFAGSMADTLQLNSGGSATPATVGSSITNNAGVIMDAAMDLTLTNVLSGPGALTKLSAGNLILQAPNLCAGPTVISAGGIVLTNAASMPNTPSIAMSPATTLDVSSLSGLTLSGAQTLSGSGTVVGNLATSAGTTLIPGNSIGTLTVTGNLALNGTTNLFELGSDATQVGNGANDLIAVGQNLTLSGVNTFTITAYGGLDTSTPYTLITYTGALSGSLANLKVTSTNPRYSFSVVDPATTPGAIKVMVIGNPVSLTWHGGQTANPTLWNSGLTSNWLNGASADVFYTGDTVLFDDTAAANSVTVTNTVQPGTMTVNNSSLNYSFSGAGALVVGSLTKTGSGSMTLANAGTNVFNSPIALNQGTLAVNQPGTNLTFPAVLIDDGSGQGTFQKLGTNVLTLNGNNANYNGAILVSEGTLKPANAAALGNPVIGATVASGATLDVGGQNLGPKTITATGPGVGGQGAIYNSDGNQQNALHNVTLAGDTTFGGTGRWDIRGSASDPAILLTGGNPYKVTKVGPNMHAWVNAAIDDGLGDIDVQQGLFSLEHGTVSPNTRGIGDPSHTLTIFGGATLQLNQLDNPLNKLIAMRDGATMTNQNGDNIITSAINLSGSNYFYVGASTLSLNGRNSGNGFALNGPGTLIMSTNNTLNLYGPNNWTGGLLINGGNVAVDDSLAFTANKNIVLSTTTGGASGGTRITVGITAGGSWIIPPGVSVNLPSGQPGDLRSILYANKGYSEWQGPINFYQQPGTGTPGSAQLSSDPSSPNTSTFVVSGPMSGVVTNLILRGGNQGAGRITGSINIGSARIEKTDLSIWTMATNNQVWGSTIIHGGTLQLGANNACPPAAFMTIGQQTTACVLDLNGFNQQVSGLASDVNPAYQFVANSSPSTLSTLTILGTNLTTFGGTIMDQAVLWAVTNNIGGGQVGLTLAAGNTGSLTLSGTNLYTGPTLLNGGTLLVNGSLSNTVVTVNNGATLGGTGVLSGPVAVNLGGTLALGPALGSLTVNNNVSLSVGSTNLMKVSRDTLTQDQVLSTGSLTFHGTLVIANVGAAPLTTGTVLKLFNAASYSGGFDSIVTTQPNVVWDASQLTVDGTLRVVSALNTTPTSISSAFHGNQLTLSWPEDHVGWSLQSNSVSLASSGSWFTVPGSTTTNQVILNIDQTKTNVFYRMLLQQ